MNDLKDLGRELGRAIAKMIKERTEAYIEEAFKALIEEIKRETEAQLAEEETQS